MLKKFIKKMKIKKWFLYSSITLLAPLISSFSISSSVFKTRVKRFEVNTITWEKFTIVNFDRNNILSFQEHSYGEPPVEIKVNRKSGILMLITKYKKGGDYYHYRNGITITLNKSKTNPILFEQFVKQNNNVNKQTFSKTSPIIKFENLTPNQRIKLEFSIYKTRENTQTNKLATVSCNFQLDEVILHTPSLDYPKLIVAKPESPFDLPPRTSKSNDARPVFFVVDEEDLNKLDFNVSPSGKWTWQKVYLKKIQESTTSKLYVLKNSNLPNLNLDANTEYRLRLTPKKENGKHYFIDKGVDKIYIKFKTKKPQTNNIVVSIPSRLHLSTRKIATTSTSADSEVEFSIHNWSSKNEYSLKIKSTYNKSKSLLQKLGGNNWIVKGLRSEEEFSIYASLLNPSVDRNDRGQMWDDGTIEDKFLRKENAPTQTRSGLIKPLVELESFYTPTTTSSNNGHIIFDIPNFNNKKMILNFHSSRRESSQIQSEHIVVNNKNQFKIINLENGERISVTISLKNKNEVWTNGKKETLTFDDESFTPGTSIVKGLHLPQIKHLNVKVKNPNTKTSNDGSLIFLIDNYDPQEIDISFSQSNLKMSKPQNNRWIIEGLSSGQEFDIFAQPKDGKYWANKKTDFAKKIFLKKMLVPNVQYAGLKKVYSILRDKVNDKKPRLSSSNDGEASLKFDNGIRDNVVTIWKNTIKRIEAQNSPSATILDEHLLGDDYSFKIVNLANAAKIKLFLKPKVGHYWEDGTKDEIELNRFDGPTTTIFGINQPEVISKKVLLASTTQISKDGIIKLIFKNFDSEKMELVSIPKNVETFFDSFESIRISGFSSGQIVRFVISPKKGFLWLDKKMGNVQFQVKMPEIISFPNNPIITKEDPTEIGGNGRIIIPLFENSQVSKLQYQETDDGKWKDAPKTGIILIGKNGFKVNFRWRLLNDNFKWINHALLAPSPNSLQLKNPGVVVVPKIHVFVNKIPIPKGSGDIKVNAFNPPLGAKLYYKTNENLHQWWQLNPTGQEWNNKKDGFKIHFEWRLEEGFVWEYGQPTPITNNEITLKDPIDNIVPIWILKTNLLSPIHNDISKIKKDSSGNYVVTLKELFGTKVTTSDIFNLFKPIDNYGIEKIIVPSSKELIFSESNEDFELIAHDLVGNTSKLIIYLETKYRIIDFKDVQIKKIDFEKSFSGQGQIATKTISSGRKKIPLIVFQNSKFEIIDILSKKLYASYRVVDSNGLPIPWQDESKRHYNGWSPIDNHAQNVFGSFYPFGFLNSNKIQIKFLSHSGYKIINDKIFEFDVTNLIEEIKDKIDEPKYIFKGNDGKGYFDFDPTSISEQLSKKVNYLVQVLRPYSPSSIPRNKIIVTKTGEPIYGIEIFIPKVLNYNMNNPNNWQLVSGVSQSFSNWDMEPQMVQKLWQEKNLASKINGVSNPEIVSSLIQPNKINTLSNFYWIRSLPYAKANWGFKWKNLSNTNIVRLYPQKFIKEIMLQNKVFSNLTQVRNLSISPLIDISDSSFQINFVPSLDKSYKYEGDLQVIPSYIPQLKNGDRFVWKYRILNFANEIESDWSEKLNIKKIKNNSKIVIGYKAIESYTISEPFNKMERVFIVKGLKHKINAFFVPRPQIVFKGYIGQGYIFNLIENDLINKQSYERTSNSLPKPRVSKDEIGGLKWQYRVFGLNPSLWSQEKIQKTPWSNNVPKNLSSNYYVQLRVAPINELRDGVEPQVYSIDSITKSKFVQVKGLEININKFQNISFEILGNKNQNIIEIIGIKDDDIARANLKELVFEVWNEKQNRWESLLALKNKLTNGMNLSFRAYARNPLLAKLPNPTNNNNVIEKGGKRYFQLESWKNMSIHGLKTIIYFRDLEIMKHEFISMEETPWEQFKKAKKINKVVSGWAKITGDIFNKNDLKKAFYTNQKGDVILAQKNIEVQYQHLKFNSKTNSMVAQGWSIIPPTNLFNGDEIQVRLAPIDPRNFELDWARELTIQVSGLYEPNLANVVSLPTLIFSGLDGKGITSLTKMVPKFYEYGYQVYNNDKDLISDWSQILPSGLSNEQYVKSRVISKKDNLKDPSKEYIDSKLLIVDGLITKKRSLKDLNLKLLTQIKIIGRINNKATILLDKKIVQKLSKQKFRIEYHVKNKLNANGKRFFNVPKNLANGDHLTLKIWDENNGINYDLNKLEKNFNGIKISGLVDEESYTKSISKAIWIPITIFVSCILLGLPIYLIRKKRKLRI